MGIDPGNEETAFIMMDGSNRIIEFGKVPNSEMRDNLLRWAKLNTKPFIAMEEIVNYGGAVGRTVFQTVEWIGRFKEVLETAGLSYETVKRKTVVSEICGNPKATDANVREELIYLFGKPGTKKSPGPTYGIVKDVWSALAIATTVGRKNGWITI